MAGAAPDAKKQRTLVQPGSFGYSREDALSTLGFFFGDPLHPDKLRDIDTMHDLTLHWPDAFAGANFQIRDTICNLLHGPKTWYTEVLPVRQSPGANVQWNQVHYDTPVLDRLPYEGVSRMVTSTRQTYRDRIIRRGIALLIENDFFKTPQGIEHFSNQLEGIRQSVQLTMNFDVMHALLSCGDQDAMYDISRGLRTRHRVRAAVANEIFLYGVVQRNAKGLDIAVLNGVERMRRYIHVDPDVIIVPPQLLVYMAVDPHDRLAFNKKGAVGVSEYEAGVAGFENRRFQGLRVCVSTPFDGENSNGASQMLDRPTMCGEHATMRAPAAYDAGSPLPPHYLDIYLYDEDQDRQVHVSAREALFAAGVGDLFDGTKDGFRKAFALLDLEHFPTNLFARQFTTNERRLALTKAALHAFTKCTTVGADAGDDDGGAATVVAGAAGVGDALAGLLESTGNSEEATERIVAQHVAVTPIDAAIETLSTPLDTNIVENVVKFAMAFALLKGTQGVAILDPLFAAGMWLPMQIVLARPFIEHRTLSAILLKSGQETGNMLWGPSDMTIAVNSATKVTEGHFSCHTRAVVYDKRNVKVLKDIMCNGYVTGGNTRFFGSEKHAGKNEPYTEDAVREAVAARLGHSRDDDETRDSILAFLVPWRATDDKEPVYTIANRVLPWEVSVLPVADRSATKLFPGGQHGWDVYYERYGLSIVHDGESVQDIEAMQFFANGSANNSLCFVGPHRVYNPFNKHFNNLVSGAGHFGSDARSGDAQWRRGDAISLDDARKYGASDADAIACNNFAM